LGAKFGHSSVDATSIQLNLGFTRPAAPHTGSGASNLTTSLPTHRFTPPTKSREEVLELCELHLRFTLAGLRVLRKNIQNHCGSIDDLDLDDILKSPAL
jgi:hypothetical protein